MSFAKSTQKSYSTHLRKYSDFCRSMGYNPIPATNVVIERYIAFLSESLQYTSIRKYLNIIRLLHIEAGLPNPLESSFGTDCLLRGIKREKGVHVTRKLPITPELLLSMRKILNLQTLEDIMFWSACLLGFFAFLRKSNLFAPSLHGFDATKHLSRSHLTFNSWGISLALYWSKNNQYRDRVVHNPVPRLGGPLCPVSAILSAIRMSWSADRHGPLFVRKDASSKWKPCLYGWFLDKLKQVLKQVGQDPSLFAGHSLRRGAATWAFKCGLPGEVIQALGDWHSQAYLSYLDIPVVHKRQHMAVFSAFKKRQ